MAYIAQLPGGIMRWMNVLTAVTASGLFAGCDHLVNALQKSVESNAQAVRTCTELNLTVEAQQSIYNRTIGDYVALSLKFPLDAEISGTSKPIPALILQIERDFARAYEDSDAATRQKLARLKVDIQNIKKTSDRVATTIRTQANSLHLGYVNLRNYAPTILSTIYIVQGDVQSLQLDTQKLRDDLTAIADQGGSVSALRKLRDEVAGTIKVIDNAISLYVAARKGDFKALLPDDAAQRKITKALKVVIEFKAAKLAVNRLERELYVIEGKLDQIDQKAWFVVSIAELLFENAIRSDVTTDKPAKDSSLRTAIDKITAAETYGASKSTIDWRLPIATAACERVMRSAEATNLTTARTDQLLNPVYLRLIENYRLSAALKSLDKGAFGMTVIVPRNTSPGGARPAPRERPRAAPPARKPPAAVARSPFAALSETLNAPFR